MLVKIAKVLVMLVRAFGVLEIVLGVLIASARLELLSAHIALGFLVALYVLVLGIMACAKRAFGVGLVGVLFGILLPVIGLNQFPLKFGSQLGLIQVVHLVVALASIGIAEALYSSIRKAA